MRFPFFRNRDSVKNGILISIRRTGDGFHPGLFSIPCSEIMYIDKSGRKAFLHTPKSTYTLNMTLSNILTHVDPNLFGKIRSSCIVNLEYVQEVVRDELLLKNGESLFVSRNYRHTIKSQHLNFIRNHF